MTKLYNVGAFGIPMHVMAQVRGEKLKLSWSRHAANEIINDKYGTIAGAKFLQQFNGADWQLVEAETTNTPRGEVVTKFVVRRAVDPVRSLVLVIVPDGYDDGFVKTAWINLNDDNHKTLDKSKFSRP